MRGGEEGSQTEEEGGLTRQEAVVVVVVEEVGKEEEVLVVGMTTTTISALILDPLVPAELGKDEAVAAVPEGETRGEEGDLMSKADMTEETGKATESLCPGPW